MKKLLPIMFLLGCGGSYDVNIPETTQKITLDGEAFQYVVVRLEFISEIKELCEDLYSLQTNEPEYRQLVASCTFDRLALINIDFGSIVDTQQALCQQDPTTLTPDQLSVFNVICQGIN